MNRMDRMKGEFSFLNPFLILLILFILSVLFLGLRLAALRGSRFKNNSLGGDSDRLFVRDAAVLSGNNIV